MGRSLPVYSTGTVTVAEGSGVWTVTGSGGVNFIAPDGVPNFTLLAGDNFVIPGVGFSTIDAVLTASTFTLDNWTAGAVSSASAYKIYRFEGLPSQQVAALLTQLLTTFTDANPPPYMTIDTGALRVRIDDDGAGNARLRVRPSGSPDSAYVAALTIADGSGNIEMTGLRMADLAPFEMGAANSYQGWNAYYSGSAWVYRAGDYAYAWQHKGNALALYWAGNGTAGTTPGFSESLSISGDTGAVSFPSGAEAPSDWQHNRLINSGFDIWQTGTSFSIANNAFSYTADQWIVNNHATGVTISAAKVATTFSSLNGIGINGTSVVAGGIIEIAQRCEGQLLRDLASGYVTVSFDLYATTSAGSLTGYVRFSSNASIDDGTFGSYSAETAFTIPSIGARIKVTLPPSVTANLAVGAQLIIGFQQNSAPGTLYIAVGGIQLEKGIVANAWSPKTAAQEYSDCLRFLRCSWPNDASPSTASAIWIAASVNITGGQYLPSYNAFGSPMRVTPSITLYDTAGSAGDVSVNFTNGQPAAAGGISATGFNSIQNNTGATIAAGTSVIYHYRADARL
jgi:hypothetical protein